MGKDRQSAFQYQPAHRWLEVEVLLSRAGSTAMKSSRYCGILVWQSGVTLRNSRRTQLRLPLARVQEDEPRVLELDRRRRLDHRRWRRYRRVRLLLDVARLTARRLAGALPGVAADGARPCAVVRHIRPLICYNDGNGRIHTTYSLLLDNEDSSIYHFFYAAHLPGSSGGDIPLCPLARLACTGC